MAIDAYIAPAFDFLFTPARNKVAYGGRGGAKSKSFARALILKAYSQKLDILCAREFQNSILDSVHKSLCMEIQELGLGLWFDITDTSIKSHLGGEFIFKGLHRNIDGIKSIPNIDICWVEEARNMSKDSLQKLPPTIRKPGSEMWYSYNPELIEDAIHQQFVIKGSVNSIVRKISWRDNPWFDETTLPGQREDCLVNDPDNYDWIWEGECKKISDAVIYKNKFQVLDFDTPENVRFYFGMDFGFANDPAAITRSFIEDNCLYIDWEAGGLGIEFAKSPGGDETTLEELLDTVPDSRKWPIKADSSRPETISFLSGCGFNISAAKKWPGSVEDGITHLKGFKMIYLHPRCVQTAKEFRLYSYKVDKNGDILPVILDKWNHYLDSERYALDGFIVSRSSAGMWERLAED